MKPLALVCMGLKAKPRPGSVSYLLGIAALLLLVGCDNRGTYGEMSNHELQQRYRECQQMGSDMAPSTGISCGNIDRECERRAKKEDRRMCF